MSEEPGKAKRKMTRRTGKTCALAILALAAGSAFAATEASDGQLGVFIVRYDEDNNVTSPIRLTVRRASGKPLTDAALHLTDDCRIHTESYFEGNADGSVDITLHPCSFAFLELK